jgi:general stress protein YciG
VRKKKKKRAAEMTVLEHMQSIAAQGGKARAERLSPKRKSAIARKGGKIGGKARAEALTKEQRSEIARKAAAARWKKQEE